MLRSRHEKYSVPRYVLGTGSMASYLDPGTYSEWHGTKHCIQSIPLLIRRDSILVLDEQHRNW